MPPRAADVKSGSSFVRNKLAKKGQTAKTKKEHGYDARNYHQNVNRAGIHALTMFQCPVCGCKNTVRVTPDKKAGTAVVKCTYCMSLDPMPEDLPYPYVTVFRQKEVVADAFFRFDNAYRKLLAQQGEDAVVSVTASTSGGRPGGAPTNAPAQGLIGHLLDALSSDDDDADDDAVADDANKEDAHAEAGETHPQTHMPHTPEAQVSSVAAASTDAGNDAEMVSDLENFFNDSD